MGNALDFITRTGPEKELRNYHVHLEGIQIDGRWVVVYSKYDIGCAIEGHKFGLKLSDAERKELI